MLKEANLVKVTEQQATHFLQDVLKQVPAIKKADVTHEALSADDHADVLAHVDAFGKHHLLFCEVKSTGQPRHVRAALLQLRAYQAHYGKEAIPVLIAPYLSPAAQALCRAQEVGFLDFEGNVHLAFDGIFIDRQVASRPIVEKRELRSIFKPKSAQVLRVLLRDPSRRWRVAELASTAGVSLGHVSNVRTGLLDREWAQVSNGGIHLAEPDALLDAWRDDYEPPSAIRRSFYTTLHGKALDEAARRGLSKDEDPGLAMYASFSAAQWLAPYVRSASSHFYSDAAGLERLQAVLKLSPVPKGENIIVDVLKDAGLFRDAVELAPGAYGTSPVQTYLDLANAGDRGREAADHLRREKLQWRN